MKRVTSKSSNGWLCHSTYTMQTLTFLFCAIIVKYAGIAEGLQLLSSEQLY